MGSKMLAFALLGIAATFAFAEGAAPLSPLVVDGERYFTVEWQAADTQVWGRIRNEWGFAARKVRLLVDSLDASGAVTAQTIAYVPFDLTPGAGSYFQANVPRAAAYRVTVYQWEWIQSGGGDTVR
jgi:hypothetical protein